MAITSTVRPGAGAPGAGRYAAQVRAVLSDLSTADRDVLAGDLESHLAEIADGGPLPYPALVERLGPPRVYADGLREAAGFGPAPAAVPGTEQAAAGRVAAGPAARGMTWWLRGLVVVTVLTGCSILLGSGPGVGFAVLVVLAWIGTVNAGIVASGAAPGTRRYADAFHRLPDVARLRQAKADLLQVPGIGRLWTAVAWTWWCVRGLVAVAVIGWLVLAFGWDAYGVGVPDVDRLSGTQTTWLMIGLGALALILLALVAAAGVLPSIAVGRLARRHPMWRIVSVLGSLVTLAVLWTVATWT